MKRIYYTLFAFAFLATSCAKEEVSEATDAKQITKEVKAEIVNGETTVTITTTEDGETKTEILTGAEAEKYMEEDHIDGSETPENAKVIIKKMNSEEVNLNLDIDEILNDPELQDLDEEIKAKIKTALENSLNEMDMDVHVEHSGDPEIKTKVMIITDDEDN